MTRRAQARASGLAIALLTTAPIFAQIAPPTPAPAATVPAEAFLPEIGAPYLSIDNAWPARWGDLEGRGHGAVVPVDAIPTTLRVKRVQAPASREPTAEDLADENALKASLGDAGGADAKATFLLEGPNAILFQAIKGRERRGLGVGPGSEAGPNGGFSFKVVSGTARREAPASGPVIELQRTWFVWYDAIAADGKPDASAVTRAALVMPGMFGNPEPTIDRLVFRLRQEGYGVLRMLAQPSRFTQSVDFRIDVADLPGSAATIAAVLGDRAAECAYSAERAWDYVEGQRPGVRGAPKALLGMSGGAITLPVVYARNPGRYLASVMIAGSADFWLTNERSNYRQYIDAIRSRWNAPPSVAQREELDRLYLGASPLDNFHAAGVMKGRRVLILQGTIDQAAPASLGDVLWERAGRPERWTYPVGHELLFAGLPQEFDKLMAWLSQGQPPARQENNDPSGR